MISCNEFTEKKITNGKYRCAYPYSRVYRLTVRDKLLGIDYVIPGNDDSAKAVALYARGIADAILEGRANAVADVAKAVAAEGEDEFVEVSA